MEELILYVREAVDRKQENMRRRKRRDALRLQLIRVFDLIAEFGTFGIRYVKSEKNKICMLILVQLQPKCFGPRDHVSAPNFH